MAGGDVDAVSAPDVRVPTAVRIAFAHAAVQWHARSVGADVLHVKGATVSETLVPDRSYTDADVLVRPEHVARLLKALRQSGWSVLSSFANSSSFEHSATLQHRDFGLLDLHRQYPGIGPTPARAFETLWEQRQVVQLGAVDCAAPCDAAHAVLLLVHAARGGRDSRAARDIRAIWSSADDARRAELLDWVDRLDAGLAFSVVTGTLDDHRDDPAYDLWRVASRGGTRTDEWRARVRAARGPVAKARTAVRSTLVNVEHLTIQRGRPVTRREVVAEFFSRARRAVGELARRRQREGRADG